jgi:hypothetical protein
MSVIEEIGRVSMNIDEKLKLIEGYKQEVIDEINFNKQYINSIHDNNFMDASGKAIREININNSKTVVDNLNIELKTIIKIEEILNR